MEGKEVYSNLYATQINANIDTCYYRYNKDLECSIATYTINDLLELLDIVK